MQSDQLRQLVQRLVEGAISTDDLVNRIEAEYTEDLDEVSLDVDRRDRCGFPEVIYGEGKTTEAVIRTAHALRARKQNVLVTRLGNAQAEALTEEFPEGIYNKTARTFRMQLDSASELAGRVVVVTAGTSDFPVAEEALETLKWMGIGTDVVRDVGVAGPHRLRERIGQLDGADAIVVVAGMEGALPSVVGGYVAVPIVAVPTSVGYGANFGGLSALLGMLNSCASNVTVVNIDAGFKGGYVSGLIAANAAKARDSRS